MIGSSSGTNTVPYQEKNIICKHSLANHFFRTFGTVFVNDEVVNRHNCVGWNVHDDCEEIACHNFRQLSNILFTKKWPGKKRLLADQTFFPGSPQSCFFSGVSLARFQWLQRNVEHLVPLEGRAKPKRLVNYRLLPLMHWLCLTYNCWTNGCFLAESCFGVSFWRLNILKSWWPQGLKIWPRRTSPWIACWHRL